ncbi:MAG: hypothetical protein WEB19_03605 [Acidimicrobiia bacterium]
MTALRPSASRLLAALLVLLATACAGPEAPLVVGMNDRTVDLVLGARVRVVTEVVPPALPLRITLPRPGQTFPAAGVFTTFPPAPPAPCAPTVPLTDESIPAHQRATAEPQAPPAEATYDYDTLGFVLFVDPDQNEGAPSPENVPLGASVLPVKTTRTVGGVAAEPPVGSLRGYTYDVVWEAGDRASTSSYRIVVGPQVAPPPSEPTGSLPQDPPVTKRIPGANPPVQPGLYLTQGDRGTAGGFHPPAPGMRLVDFPVVAGASFATTATDGVSTIDYTSTVGFSPVVINACGTWVEGWPVAVDGTVASADPEFLGHQLARFNARYTIAPQFGGLIIDEEVEVTTPGDGQNVPFVPLRYSTARLAQAPEPVPGSEGGS